MRLKLLTFLFFLFGSAYSNAQEQLTLLVSSSEKLIYVDPVTRTIVGPVADILRKIGTMAGFAVELQVLPTKRAMLTVTRNTDTCFAGRVKTIEEEDHFKWSVAIAKIEVNLYSNPTRKITVNDVSEINKKIVGVERGTIMEDYIRRNLPDAIIDEADTSISGLTKLLAGRDDFWASGDFDMRLNTEKLGIPALKSAIAIGAFEAGIACNKSVSDALMGKLDAAIKVLVKNGDLKFLGL